MLNRHIQGRGLIKWIGAEEGTLTISFRILISLKSMRFSSSSMWLLRSTLTARWAPDSLCTHMRTSPNAPILSSWVRIPIRQKGRVWSTYLCQAPCRFCRSHVVCPTCGLRNQRRGCQSVQFVKLLLQVLRWLWVKLHRGQQKSMWRQISSDLPSTIFSLLPCQFKYLF